MISPKKEIKNKMNPFLIWMSTVPKERLINSQYYSSSTYLVVGIWGIFINMNSYKMQKETYK